MSRNTDPKQKKNQSKKDKKQVDKDKKPPKKEIPQPDLDLDHEVNVIVPPSHLAEQEQIQNQLPLLPT